MLLCVAQTVHLTQQSAYPSAEAINTSYNYHDVPFLQALEVSAVQRCLPSMVSR